MLYEHINGYLNTEVVINENDVIIDIGANIGIFGIKLSKLFDNKITILSFEPIKDIYSVLKKNSLITQNKNFKVLNVAFQIKMNNLISLISQIVQLYQLQIQRLGIIMKI